MSKFGEDSAEIFFVEGHNLVNVRLCSGIQDERIIRNTTDDAQTGQTFDDMSVIVTIKRDRF